MKNIVNNLQNFDLGAVQRFLYLVDLIRPRKMLSNEYLVAKIGVDTADIEPLKIETIIHQYFIHSLVDTAGVGR